MIISHPSITSAFIANAELRVHGYMDFLLFFRSFLFFFIIIISIM